MSEIKQPGHLPKSIQNRQIKVGKWTASLKVSDVNQIWTELHRIVSSHPFVNLIQILGLSENAFHKATKIDGKILQKSEFLNYYASVRVIEMTKK